MDVIPVSLWLQLAQMVGVPLATLIIVLVFVVLRKQDEKHYAQLTLQHEKQFSAIVQQHNDDRKNEDLRRDNDRQEHMQKWASMLEDHKTERNRQHELYLRMAEALELHARLIQTLTAKIDSNQYCPVIRKGT